MARPTKAERDLRDLRTKLAVAEQGKKNWMDEADEWRKKTGEIETRLEARTSSAKRDVEILIKDVEGYKSEVTRLNEKVLHLQAQIGRICIEKGIVR